MARLYVTEQFARIHLERGRLIVEQDGRMLASYHKRTVDAISVVGRVSVSTPVIQHSLKGFCDIAFFSPGGKYLGRLSAAEGKNIPLRIAQVRLLDNPERRSDLAATILEAKIRNCHRFILRQKWNGWDGDVETELKRLKRWERKCRKVDDLAMLRSLEGKAAREYFRCLGLLVRPFCDFQTRIRRPPVGIFNVLLSLGYSMVSAECAAAVESTGLDPAIGVLHGIRYGRPSLGLDLVEEFRTPVAERLAVKLLTLKLPEFMNLPEDVNALSEQALKRYFEFYEKLMTRPVKARYVHTTLRQAIHKQASSLASYVRSGAFPYAPFYYR